MDGILALGHFCETHGPCVILCTQRYKEEPQQFPHILTVPVCEACQSLDVEQALVSKEEHTCYVTTRTPLQQDLAFLLRQAVVRSLSCEETSKEGGTLYFGDIERGHVISHIFTVQDSLARGFHRKYCILMLMRDRETFQKTCYCYLTGIRVDALDPAIEQAFRQLLPTRFTLPKTGETCKIFKQNDTYHTQWNGTLPQKLPSLLSLIEKALNDENLPDTALAPYVMSLVLQWHNIACAVRWAPNENAELLKSLGVQKQDMPLLSYWVPQCKESNF